MVGMNDPLLLCSFFRFCILNSVFTHVIQQNQLNWAMVATKKPDPNCDRFLWFSNCQTVQFGHGSYFIFDSVLLKVSPNKQQQMNRVTLRFTYKFKKTRASGKKLSET